MKIIRCSRCSKCKGELRLSSKCKGELRLGNTYIVKGEKYTPCVCNVCGRKAVFVEWFWGNSIHVKI